MTKYNSKKVEYKGITFDSKSELQYFQELEEKVANGEIKSFSIQPTYTLIESFEKFGKKYRAMTYTPDFLVTHNDNSIQLVDIKGFGTIASEMRKKLFDYKYRDVELIWLTYSKKYGGWVRYHDLIKLRKENKKNLNVVKTIKEDKVV